MLMIGWSWRQACEGFDIEEIPCLLLNFDLLDLLSLSHVLMLNIAFLGFNLLV